MSATDQMRAMLDQLMGTARNGEEGRGLKFSDARVCKSFLLDCCPHDILQSTRMDLGECRLIHELALRADYENAAKNKDYYYDVEAMEHLQAFIADCDRRTEAAKLRLKETQEEVPADVAEKADAVHSLSEEIGKKLAKVEALGAAGQVEESMVLMGEIEELRQKKIRAEHEYRTSMPASTYQQQKLRVCEVCSAYLGIHDNDIRLADHFGGKLHLGFLTIREKLAALEVTAGPRKEELKRSGKIHERDEERKRSRYFVGGRELDRRSRVHRSKSRDRQIVAGGQSRQGQRSTNNNSSEDQEPLAGSKRSSERSPVAAKSSPERERERDRERSRSARSTERRRERSSASPAYRGPNQRAIENNRFRMGGGGGSGGGGGGGGGGGRFQERERFNERDRGDRGYRGGGGGGGNRRDFGRNERRGNGGSYMNRRRSRSRSRSRSRGRQQSYQSRRRTPSRERSRR